MKLGVLFGGMSSEHDVSIVSGLSILKNLDKEKYEILPIYINKKGEWFKLIKILENEKIEQENLEKIENETEILKQCDVVFPVLHGKYGEDGTIQGMLELLEIPYVGVGVLASSIAMDKAYTKIIFEKAGIKQAKYVYLKKVNQNYILIDNKFNEKRDSLENICMEIEKNINYPMFVKPSNSGSSVGINKAKNIEELKEYIEYASKFDDKILIGIIGKEIECAVMGNDIVKASTLGEIRPAEDFYSYNAKYNDNKSQLIIPASISEEISKKVKEIAIKAFKAIDGEGLSRVDFFVNTDTNEIYINEINTMPGFTSISMYPKLWEYDGVKYSDLLDKLINLAIEK